MPKTTLKKEKWTLSFDPKLKEVYKNGKIADKSWFKHLY